MDFSTSNIFGIAAIGSLVAFWSQIKGWFSSVVSLVIRTDVISDYSAFHTIARHLLSKSSIIRWGNVEYGIMGWERVKRPNGLAYNTSILGRCESSLFLLYKGWIPVILHGNKEITYLFHTLPLEAIMEEWVKDEYERFDATRIKASKGVTGFSWREESGVDSQNLQKSNPLFAKSESVGTPVAKAKEIFSINALQHQGKYIGIKFEEVDLATMEDSKFSPRYFWGEESKRLCNEIEFFIQRSTWFREKQLPHFRGVLLYGAPGTGKSLAVYESARANEVRVTKINLSNMTNNEFTSAFSAGKGSPHVILIEDVDTVFNGRENVLAASTHSKQLLSFDHFINTISGLQSNDGTFLILTTNHPEKLDPALIRAGRCDVKIEMKPLCAEGRKHIANNVLGDWPELVSEVLVANEIISLSAADFESLCIERARKKIYERQDGGAP